LIFIKGLLLSRVCCKTVTVSTRAAREAWRTMYELFLDGEARRRMHEVCAHTGLSPGLMKALFQLDEQVAVPMRDLAEHWGCDASYVTSLADGLAERGFAERRPDPTDRRIKAVALTAAGAAAKQRALELLFEPPPAVDVLSGAEQRQLRDLLAKVAAADVELARRRAVSATAATSVARLRSRAVAAGAGRRHSR
jgi:DNA-binding MarR family transcriptional regulator